jgi:hypothetical protein
MFGYHNQEGALIWYCGRHLVCWWRENRSFEMRKKGVSRNDLGQ